MKRVAVVANPVKFDDPSVPEAVRAAISAHGWADPMWLETTVDDPGTELARSAVRAEVDLVIACGGDGTVTACAAALTGSGIPLGVLPTGTGNLLARNLGLPLDLNEALAIALEGTDRSLDVGSMNGRPFIVMAGVGFDARMFSDTSEAVKKRIGSAAYVLAAIRHLHDRPARIRLRADNGVVVRLLASAVIIGNVGSLHAGIALLPDAQPDDGVLDAVVLTARGWTGWLTIAAQILLGRRATGQMTRMTFSELHIDVGRAQPWQIDGDVIGRARHLVITVQPGSLLLRVPG